MRTHMGHPNQQATGFDPARLDIYAHLAYKESWTLNGTKTNATPTSLNIRVDFVDAVGVFYDEMAMTVEDPDSINEQRLVTIGLDFNLQVLVVVSMQRVGDVIRLVSARKANKQERRQYEA